MKDFDYIILGAGASGLQLAYRMALDAFFDDKHIIIVDKEYDKGNDHTWSFWETGKGEWDDIVFKSWDKIYFGSEWLSKTINIAPFSYKMIKSEAYYKKLWAVIKSKPNIRYKQAEVNSISESDSMALVETSVGQFQSKNVFNSIVFSNNYSLQTKYPVLQQHFVGWFIKTEKPIFDDSVATFMDFDIPQNGNTRFMYILPTSTTEALFEYTLFSKDLLKISEYEDAIKEYLNNKDISNYEVTATEMGMIPMTSYNFYNHNSKHILQIGTAGGWTKASTGYTFMNTTKQTKALVSFLKHTNDVSKFAKRTRFWFYDVLMLDVLAKENMHGAKLFSDLFKKVKVQSLFRFLDEESSLSEEIKIMSSVELARFTKALINRLF